MMPIQDEHLPRLLVALHDTDQTLREACPELSEAEGALCAQIEQWEQSLLTQFARVDPSTTSEKLMSRCRQAPPDMLLKALIAQQEALRTLSENNPYAECSNMSTEDAAFWSEEGDGYWAIELGKAALQSTWWPYHSSLRAWADTCAGDILAVLEQAEMLLQVAADRQSVCGVLEPCMQQVTALRSRLGAKDS